MLSNPVLAVLVPVDQHKVVVDPGGFGHEVPELLEHRGPRLGAQGRPGEPGEEGRENEAKRDGSIALSPLPQAWNIKSLKPIL